jgi:hypothetical protein
MVEANGRYAIAPGAFDRETLLALAALGPIEPDLQPSARPRDRGGTDGDARPEPDSLPSAVAEAWREAVSA